MFELTGRGENYYERLREKDSLDSLQNTDFTILHIIGIDPEHIDSLLKVPEDRDLYRGSIRRLFEEGYIEKVD